MNPSYEWITFGRKLSEKINVKPIIDIMGAPISSPEEFREYIHSVSSAGSNITICLSGELKKYGDGRPASNYRLEHDESLNENVIKNYFYLIELYFPAIHQPIIVTTIPREMRLYSWFITESGEIIREDQQYRRELNSRYNGYNEGEEKDFDKNDEYFMNMLYKFGIDSEKLKIIRESCKNSKYHSYMIDMISFIYQTMIGTSKFHSIFQPEYRMISSVFGGDPVGRWTPKENMNYLYFDDCHDEYGRVYFIPKNESIKEIYHLFDLIINPYENKAKESVRDHLDEFTIHRWSDFDANDTDDIFTIIMILHCYSCDTVDHEPISLTIDQYNIKMNLQNIIESWKSRNSL